VDLVSLALPDCCYKSSLAYLFTDMLTKWLVRFLNTCRMCGTAALQYCDRLALCIERPGNRYRLLLYICRSSDA
jgi:hypothetical protein